MADVPLIWQLGKLLASIGLVLGLGLVAVRVSPRVAGLLAGYPLGTALALFFIGLEISPGFATQSAIYTLAGFTATLALGGGYLVCGGRTDGIKGVLMGSLGGLSAWVAVGWSLSHFEFTRFTGTLVTLVAIGVFTWLYRRVPETRVNASGTLSWSALGLRAALATLMIFVITALAHWVPAAWAGTLAAFPVTMLPFLVILHAGYGAAPASTVIKHYPMGLGALLSYTLCVSLTYASWGLAAGTLAGFIVATLWLVGWMRCQQWWAARRSTT